MAAGLMSESNLVVDNGNVRKFETGATRDTGTNKLDFEGFESPLVMESYANYLNKHRKQSDGALRDSDNWQKGIPRNVYIKSAFRHFFAVWKIHRGYPAHDEKGNLLTLEDSINGLLFNMKGYLFEMLKERNGQDRN